MNLHEDIIFAWEETVRYYNKHYWNENEILKERQCEKDLVLIFYSNLKPTIDLMSCIRVHAEWPAILRGAKRVDLAVVDYKDPSTRNVLAVIEFKARKIGSKVIWYDVVKLKKFSHKYNISRLYLFVLDKRVDYESYKPSLERRASRKGYESFELYLEEFPHVHFGIGFCGEDF